MKPNLALRPTLDEQYETQYQKIEEIKRHLKAERSGRLGTSHQSHKILLSRQKTKEIKISQGPLKLMLGKNGSSLTARKRQENYGKSNKRMNTLNTERNLYATKLQRPDKTLSIREYLVEHQNKKLIEAIKSHEINKKQFKRKLATQVGEYEKLREHMQKYKKNFTVVLAKPSPKTERQNSCDFRKFLTEAIQETKKKMQPKQFYTRTTDHE